MSNLLAGPDPVAAVSEGGAPPRTILSAGVVAHNEERNLETAVRSLLSQKLPAGVNWNTVWIVASGCTDGSVEIARRLAEEDSRVRLVVEKERTGKAHALGEVFRRARGDGLVLLNSDARAEPEAVAELLRVSASHPAPFAVMGRPVVAEEVSGRWTGMLTSMWELHHEYHRDLAKVGGGTHLSDELLLVSLPKTPPIPDGIINDGSYFGVWLSQHGGGRLYAPEARVVVEIPSRIRDHLHQRRRIQLGNDQVRAILGSAPSTLVSDALRRPHAALDLVRRSVLSRKKGMRHLVALAASEFAARSMSYWDRIPPRKDHVRWHRIQAPSSKDRTESASPTGSANQGDAFALTPSYRRVSTLVEVASRFGTGIPLEQLVELLPRDAPSTATEILEWLSSQPELGRVEGGRVISHRSQPIGVGSRRERGVQYQVLARSLVRNELVRALPWLRCMGVTGSTAYGEPEEGDDIDFFVVTRAGALWWFLAYTYFVLRMERRRNRHAGSTPEFCINYVLDDHSAPVEFARKRGLLFAREALAARMVWGEEYYASLLRSAPWMAEEIPRLFPDRSEAGVSPHSHPAPVPVRILNALVAPLVVTYLQLAGLKRNRRLERLNRPDARFVTRTGWHGMAYLSRRFESLRGLYESTGSTGRARGAASPSRLPTAR